MFSNRQRATTAFAALALFLHGCGQEPVPSGPRTPSPTTARANAAVLDELPFDDQTDFEDARRGLIAAGTNPVVGRFEYQQGDAPASVNPSLWRQAQLNGIHGLFEVVEGIYQVRGYDLANITLIAGDEGWIVVDPLTTREAASAAMALVEEHLGKRPVTALIYTHSHIDHFGGSRAILSQIGANERVPVVAPEGFVVEAVSENVLARNTMARRASYMFGFSLDNDALGHVDSGLGKASVPGTFGLLPPNTIVSETGTKLTLDGVEFVFQNTPGAEAPAELMFYLPEKGALCGAENVSHVLHNLYTLRGAKVRDALRWSGYIDESLMLFPDVEVIFASHHWPIWGHDRIVAYLEKQRDVYKYIHDQTLRLANHGLTPREIAEEIELPESLAQSFANRGYYGTVRHNTKAVYQHYFGWFDGNPANLDPLPPEPAAKRYVEYMGGGDAILEKARATHARGSRDDYRWVAEVLSHVVFAEPDNRAARELLADTYDQLGYQAESGPWRDFYLTGAKELREGPPALDLVNLDSLDIVAAIPTSLFFDALAVRLNGPKAAEEDSTINFVFDDIDETHVVTVKNGVLHHRQGAARDDADATLELSRATWNEIVTDRVTLPELILEGRISIGGSRLALIGFFSLLDDFDPSFPIVSP